MIVLYNIISEFILWILGIHVKSYVQILNHCYAHYYIICTDITGYVHILHHMHTYHIICRDVTSYVHILNHMYTCYIICTHITSLIHTYYIIVTDLIQKFHLEEDWRVFLFFQSLNCKRKWQTQSPTKKLVMEGS